MGQKPIPFLRFVFCCFEPKSLFIYYYYYYDRILGQVINSQRRIDASRVGLRPKIKWAQILVQVDKNQIWAQLSFPHLIFGKGPKISLKY